MKLLLTMSVVVFVVIGGIYFLFQKNSTLPASTLEKSQNTGQITKSATDIPLTIVAENLEVPWAIAFLPASPQGGPDNRMLVTERPGRVRIVNTDGTVEQSPVANISVDVESDGEGGLLGIALHPDFNQNNYVYLYHTYQSTGNETLNRVIRMKFENNKLTNKEIIVDKIPGAIYHNGGRIKFGSDGYLYITTGDARNSSKAQDTNSLAGKILRVTDQGKAVLGNPFNNLVYSYGHRNPQGIAWDSNGQLWETEHGRSNPTGYDEINLIQSGKNYGWEIIQGNEARNGMETPKRNSGATTTWAPSGTAFIGNSLFFAGLKGETLYEAVIRNNQVAELKEHLAGQYGRLREVVAGPDGMLYITTSNKDGRGNPENSDDKIIKVNPQKL
ncbi:MAG: PQQ-dependent sugar dehydrogenase [Candidatus Levybacteria bacterium]|nr:PQQ-dependent sugar dehydrogenase [Candidatus Levybacteria bacterium]